MNILKRDFIITDKTSLQLQAESEKCTHCHTCIENCPMSLPVEGLVLQDRMENTECILCGTCIDGCPSGVIKYAFRIENQ